MSSLRFESNSRLSPSLEVPRYKRDTQRYYRIIAFFSVNFLKALGWEIVLKYFFGEKFVARRRGERTLKTAEKFRALAVEMGGVMIKLGQFLSTRVDVLPERVIRALEGLQDEVAPVEFSQIRQVIAQELGSRFDDFVDFVSTPVAAASLGQVYKARLDGQNVVVKVQRPGIRNLVQTDLDALAVVSGWGMKFRFIRRRADLPHLLQEFASVLWEELDYVHEAQNAERFARLFADESDIYVPSICHDYTTHRVLVMEDVSAIKLNDYAALEAAGIDRRAVALRLLDTYLMQVFIEHFFHADPHPGNIFVKPVQPTNGAALPRNFQLIFVDFGMMGCIAAELGETLRRVLISVGLRDARGLVECYEELGVLMPDADRERVVDATRFVFDMVYGLDMDAVLQLEPEKIRQLISEFRDIFLSVPFKVPQNLIYLGRCGGILAGLCKGLDPDFNPWVAMQPYVVELVRRGKISIEEESASDSESLGDLIREMFSPENILAMMSEENLKLSFATARDYLVRAVQLPVLADEILRKADRGDLQTRIKLDSDLKEQLDRIEANNRRLSASILLAGLAISGAILWRERK